jgi:hypothetical protein
VGRNEKIPVRKKKCLLSLELGVLLTDLKFQDLFVLEIQEVFKNKKKKQNQWSIKFKNNT